MLPRSAVEEITWPALPDGKGALLLALQYQFQESERLSRVELEHRQLDALGRLLRHATETVPYYRDRAAYRGVATDGPPDAATWGDLPILTRADVQAAGGTLLSESVPSRHLPLVELSTSGSTGRPLRGVATRINSLFWLAVTLRDHLWHGRDLKGTLAAIRPVPGVDVPPGGLLNAGWGPSTDLVFSTGPCAVLNIQRDVAEQAEWLIRTDADYLLTLPSNVVALADHFGERNLELPRLRQVRTYGEALSDDVRSACRAAWGVEVTDMYSTQELGYIALQCPVNEHYHVQSEVAYVEVLDDDGRPCRPGQTGRVVVSALHNFAMPWLRYDVGDYARVGGECSCGRALPVLERIMGRARNMVKLPTGERFWPTFADVWRSLDVIRQFQLVQREIDHIEARIVARRPLAPEEERQFTAIVGERFHYPFRVSFTYLDGIDRSRDLKFEDFVCLV
jgi:phenylacetate-CoA ligase